MIYNYVVFFFEFVEGDGEGMVVGIFGNKKDDKMIVCQCLVHSL